MLRCKQPQIRRYIVYTQHPLRIGDVLVARTEYRGKRLPGVWYSWSSAGRAVVCYEVEVHQKADRKDSTRKSAEHGDVHTSGKFLHPNGGHMLSALPQSSPSQPPFMPKETVTSFYLAVVEVTTS